MSQNNNTNSVPFNSLGFPNGFNNITFHPGQATIIGQPMTPAQLQQFRQSMNLYQRNLQQQLYQMFTGMGTGMGSMYGGFRAGGRARGLGVGMPGMGLGIGVPGFGLVMGLPGIGLGLGMPGVGIGIGFPGGLGGASAGGAVAGVPPAGVSPAVEAADLRAVGGEEDDETRTGSEPSEGLEENVHRWLDDVEVSNLEHGY